MALPIRQGATHKVVLGPVVAVGDGFTPITNLDVSTSDEAEAILHDNGTVIDISGYTWAAIAVANGYYHLTLQSAISNTVGHMTVIVNDDSLCLPVKADFVVLDTAAYDAIYKDAAVMDVHAKTIENGIIVAATLGADCITEAKIADNAIAAEHIANAAIDNATFAADVGSTAYATNIIALAVRKSLDEIKLDHLIAIADADDVVDNSVIAKLANSGATADWSAYVNTTDSLMAIRDHIGDGTNLTEAGGDGDHLTAINLPNQTMDITGSLSGSVGSVTGHTNQTGDNFAIVNGAAGLVAIDTVVDAIKLVTDRQEELVVAGTASGTPTTATMISNITINADDQFNGRIIIFRKDTSTPNLQGQATDITASASANDEFTFTALTTPPVSGDTFEIV